MVNYQKALRVLIAAGSSAGHLYPALALAQRLENKDPLCEIAFVSTRRGGLEQAICSEGYKVFFLSIRPFVFGFRGLLASVYYFLKSFIEAFFIIEEFRPDVVAGFGSYLSFPVLLEASFFKKNTLIHEQNVSLGLANRLLSPFADKIAFSFNPKFALEKQIRQNNGKKIFQCKFYRRPPTAGVKESVHRDCRYAYTGYPLGRRLVKEDRKKSRDFFGLQDKFTLLIAGGSQGAHKINSEFSLALDTLDRGGDFQFIHICGRRDYSDLKKRYSCIKINHCLFDFLPQMRLAYSASDLVICRSGAGTIFELAYFNKAAILIPYPYASGHQRENARVLERAKAAIVLEEERLDCRRLSGEILDLMRSDLRRKALEKNIQGFCREDAGESLAELVMAMGNY